jgi:Mlc titration factor MtfA (ptsG expression regulator)
MGILKNWLRKRTLARHAIPASAWLAAVNGLPLLAGLDAQALERLRALASLFLHE